MWMSIGMSTWKILLFMGWSARAKMGIENSGKRDKFILRQVKQLVRSIRETQCRCISWSNSLVIRALKVIFRISVTRYKLKTKWNGTYDVRARSHLRFLVTYRCVTCRNTLARCSHLSHPDTRTLPLFPQYLMKMKIINSSTSIVHDRLLENEQFYYRCEEQARQAVLCCTTCGSKAG